MNSMGWRRRARMCADRRLDGPVTHHISTIQHYARAPAPAGYLSIALSKGFRFSFQLIFGIFLFSTFIPGNRRIFQCSFGTQQDK